MLCDDYKDALMEAAAGGAALAEPVRAHVETCADCRATFAAQRMIFAAIDVGLQSGSNAAIPANFEHRLRARLQQELSPRRRSTAFVFALGSVAAAVAVVVIVFAARGVLRREYTSSPVPAARTDVSQPAESSDKNKLEIEKPEALMSIAHASRRSKAVARSVERMEVLVPRGQEELLVKYMEGINWRRARVVLSTNLQQEAETKPLQVPAIEISELAVKPLSDLSAN